MSGKLSRADRDSIRAARRDGILQDEHLGDGKLDLTHGVILVPCADGDQFAETVGHVAPAVQQSSGRPRMHILTVNGGTLVLSPTSPLRDLSQFVGDFANTSLAGRRWWKIIGESALPVVRFAGRLLRQDIPLLINIWTAVQLKGINTVALFIHAPCGAAGACHMSFEDTLRHLIAAKRRLKSMQAFAGVKFPCLCHVDYGIDGEGAEVKRTYFIKTHAAEAWLEKRAKSAKRRATMRDWVADMNSPPAEK